MRCNQVMHKVNGDITKKLTTCRLLSNVKFRKAFIDAITWFSNFVFSSDSSLLVTIFSASIQENQQSIEFENQTKI